MSAGRPYSGVTVLDLAHELGSYASRLFADLGADVIRVESSRDADGPTQAGGEAASAARSTFVFCNAGKARIELDPRRADDRARLAVLVRRAQLVFMERGGLFADEIEWVRSRNASLVIAHVSPFGMTGPHAHWRASDLTLQAAGGIAWLCGRPGEPPLRLAAGQSAMITSTYAAAVAAVALFDAEASGQGHLIDVSGQECIAHSLQHSLQAYDLEGVVASRSGAGTRDAAEAIFKCKDGRMLVASPVGLGPSWHSLVDWIAETGHPAGATLKAPCWLDARWRKTPEAQQQFRCAFAAFIALYSRKEILREALARKIVMAPVSRIGDVLDDEQLAHRDFFVAMAGCVADRPIRFPGAPYQFSEPVWAVGK
ncbi:MAG: CoA transferase [Burkholderiales bacterium]|nr:CoA transferase [Burkholderiales bacterium]